MADGAIEVKLDPLTVAMAQALAEIDAALGLPEDGCNSTERTLAKVRNLRAALSHEVECVSAARAEIEQLRAACERSYKRTDAMQFLDFPKMARLRREVIVTEKIDGTNAQVLIADDGHDAQPSCRGARRACVERQLDSQ